MENKEKKNLGITLTIVCNITSNYGETLGNASSVQKVFKNGKIYATRSRESMKNAIMTQSGMYDDLKVVVHEIAQKDVTKEMNASNCRALEGGYMNTNNLTVIRKSSFYLTDAVACDEFVNETRFHNNLYLASIRAKDKGLNLQKDAKKVGLIPYQYEFDKSLKKYSITFDLDKVGVDENFNAEAEVSEKIERVNLILETIENLSLVVKGNLDNSEPLMIFGGIGNCKTHYFDNVVNVRKSTLNITDELIERLNKGNYKMAFIEGGNFANEQEIKEKLNPISITEFFEKLKGDVKNYYEG
ncbi:MULTISPECIES: type I-B CRISPR-associated protein Cas7/Cst2/DevR [unclassified Parvimonas]|uniref:type I-B CRISPR-associated protein Cas7/Cst2/DevR n=1 Tax=unclassified Parvimonas TaxID=1151464 RepID=UPI002B476286|nr:MULTISPECIES: type I-B CRISPR-associated protein Cas7/Cst2/DevR [unclassified Parvimonas]MEB3024235.1 type I-B CRISPR-associated protein Cas7/Cst2/DevR [Parvimonas sp. M13]MEB3073414.1 type I-B CRISPR-associated protein Cas7/Cst2/DevR [Parvimonas sp. C2]MEB3088381.1 type I-B CRISPR-associated protein Cas7/Cst2/DevR [Parvimonas sp. M20]